MGHESHTYTPVFIVLLNNIDNKKCLNKSMFGKKIKEKKISPKIYIIFICTLLFIAKLYVYGPP